MKKVLSVILVMLMMLSCLPPKYVKAEDTISDWSTLVNDNPEEAFAKAQAFLSEGKATLVTAIDWTTGGPYKDGNDYYSCQHLRWNRTQIHVWSYQSQYLHLPSDYHHHRLL